MCISRQTIEEGIERGGSFAAYFQGELVVNLWGGFADEEARRPWKYNTASVFYSTTKSPSAVVIGHLVDRYVTSASVSELDTLSEFVLYSQFACLQNVPLAQP